MGLISFIKTIAVGIDLTFTMTESLFLPHWDWINTADYLCSEDGQKQLNVVQMELQVVRGYSMIPAAQFKNNLE